LGAMLDPVRVKHDGSRQPSCTPCFALAGRSMAPQRPLFVDRRSLLVVCRSFLIVRVKSRKVANSFFPRMPESRHKSDEIVPLRIRSWQACGEHIGLFDRPTLQTSNSSNVRLLDSLTLRHFDSLTHQLSGSFRHKSRRLRQTAVCCGRRCIARVGSPACGRWFHRCGPPPHTSLHRQTPCRMKRARPWSCGG
jgi:hypothetical protein